MTRRNRLWSIAALTVGALAAAPLLAACGAGQIANTAEAVPAVQGGNATAEISAPGTAYDGGTIGVRNATIVYNGSAGYPAGGTAPLSLYLFNNTPAPMTLTDVRASFNIPGGGQGSATVVLTGGPQASASPSPSASTPSAPANGSAAPSGSASASASPTPTTPPAAGASTFQLTVPPTPAELTALTQQAGSYLQLDKLSAPLAPGSVVNLVFTFKLGDGSTKVVGDDPKQPLQAPFDAPSSPAPRSALPLSPVTE